MFSALPESRAARQRRTGGFIISTSAHVVLIALAVRATAWTAPAPQPLPLKPLIYVPAPPALPDAAPTTHRPPHRDDAPAVSGETAPLPPETPPAGEIPSVLPPPGAMGDLIRDDEFVRNAAPTIGGPATGRTALGSGGVFEKRAVDRVVVAIPGTAIPRYPPTLQRAGIEGEVRAQFVVDTLGRVEQGSVRILDATHDLFSDAVRNALARARFVPAQSGGRKVRQLAEQSFSFRLRARH